MNAFHFVLIHAVTAALSIAPAVHAVAVGQIDTFENVTLENWQVALIGSPSPAQPVNQAGGPSGPADRYLLLTSLGGLGPGSRLSVINFGSQWAGDYLSAGVGSISMAVNNMGNTDLFLRLAISDPVAGPPENVAYSDDPVVVLAGAGWQSITFPLDPNALKAGLGSVTLALNHATELRIYHSQDDTFPNPGVPIPPVAALLGIDNIRANAVPDNSTPGPLLAISFLATAAVAARARCRERRNVATLAR
jgi:hypothetical protein